MKKLDLGQSLSILANVGVIAGIIFLAIEVQQNNALMQAQIEQSRSETLVDWRREAASNEGIAQLLAKFSGDGATLSNVTPESIGQLDSVELVQLRMLVSAEFYDFENLFSQYERGFVSEEYWEERVVPGIRSRVTSWKVLWPPDGPSGRQAFKDEVERILALPVQATSP